jgi:hexulose-6-phosphate isomerase
MKNKIGFIQGRLSPLVDGKIQAFPSDHWRDEFFQAEKNNFHLIEWTLDHTDLYSNPLLSKEGRLEIKALCFKHDVKIPSLTGDCFMQAPFWKSSKKNRVLLEEEFLNVSDACKDLGISFIVVPLVDNGSLDNKTQEDYLVAFLIDHLEKFQLNNQKIVFESDFNPHRLHAFIQRLDSETFGINYDIGNSASLGYNVDDEFKAYGNSILNVHVKDRKYGGTTVPLGEGNANFNRVFQKLSELSYQGNFILQTARALDDNHILPLIKYRDMTHKWMYRFGL